MLYMPRYLIILQQDNDMVDNQLTCTRCISDVINTPVVSRHAAALSRSST